MAGQRQKAEDRRTSLIDAALALFSTLGYEGTTTKAVAERAQVTEAIIFRHFPTKRDLFLSVIADRGPRYLFSATYEGLPALPVRDALALVLTDYLNIFWENRSCLRMMILDTWRDPAAFHSLQDQFSEASYRLQAFLEHRATNGELKPGDSTARVDVISAALTGFLHRSLQVEPKDWELARSTFLNNLLDTLFIGIAA